VAEIVTDGLTNRAIGGEFVQVVEPPAQHPELPCGQRGAMAGRCSVVRVRRAGSSRRSAAGAAPRAG
jgi:hypothetical protein